MELRRIKLYNFSSYAGEASFDCSTNNGRNIILIGGNNGAGKTSLFTAIKLALYGPLCFRYQGKNAQYSARIKELMNHDAFTESEVKTYVEVELIVPVNQNYMTYTVHREWNYTGHRVRESYWVSDNMGLLPDRERDYFQNYLFTIIPPNMFDFFFFDGEEISNFFSDSAYNSYIKNAVLTLCGYDTFGMIKKFCDTYVGTETSGTEYGHMLEQLRGKERALEQLDANIDHLKNAVQELEYRKAAAIDEKENLEVQFKRSGGLSKKERDELNNKMRHYDRVKNKWSKIIRDYVEDIMPFYIAVDLSKSVNEQLLREENMRQYHASTQRLSISVLKDAITTTNMVSSDQIDDLSHSLYESISATLCPEKEPDQFQFLHDLSQAQRKQVLAVLGKLDGFHPRDMVQAIHSKRDATEKYDKLSRQFRKSLPSVDADTFLKKFSDSSKKISEYEDSILAAQKQLEKLNADKPLLKKEVESLRAQIQAEDKNQTAYLYTSRISTMMDALILDVVQKKFRDIEQLTLQMFHDITHKENFIDLMELDDSFNILIYKKQTYTVSELYALAENIRIAGLKDRLGNTGMQDLMNWFQITSVKMLRKSMKTYFTDKGEAVCAQQKLNLYKNVELSQLSKGEKQVFLLSLYWAIIKSSEQKIPFIIDTPFARIDTEHREQLTKLFFTSISDQVIILSTDEEVVDVYHDMIRDRVAHEYLLSNDEITGYTSVGPGYFAKGG